MAKSGFDRAKCESKPKVELTENIPAEIERITQIRNPKYSEKAKTDEVERDSAESQPWIPVVLPQNVHFEAIKFTVSNEDYLKEKGKKLQYENEIFDSLETLETDTQHYGEIPLSFRKISKDKDSFFGRYLVALEAGILLLELVQ